MKKGSLSRGVIPLQKRNEIFLNPDT
ncbi:hypothetical protein ARTHRO8AJ_90029 [Arthrobacter sp. 8AJ]|nr:hypothetical protein ARTHRO8AJ_90029 [Arthrobacter sp. 8AJ]